MKIKSIHKIQILFRNKIIVNNYLYYCGTILKIAPVASISVCGAGDKAYSIF